GASGLLRGNHRRPGGALRVRHRGLRAAPAAVAGSSRSPRARAARDGLFLVAQSSPTGRSARARVALRFEVEEPPGQWLMEEESVPETPLHDAIIELLMLVLKHWARTEARRALVTSNLGCRWEPDDARVGVDPDVVL